LLLVRVARTATPCDHRRVSSATPAERDSSTSAVAARALDLGAFFREAGRALEAIAQHDGRCWMTLDPATGLPTSHVAHDSVPPEQVSVLARNEFQEEDVNKFEALVQTERHAAALGIATAGRPECSARYRDLLKPLGFGDELRATLVDDGLAWGALALYRRENRPPFDEREVNAIARATAELTPTLRRAVLIGSIATDETSDGPGLLLLGEADAVETMSEPARRWLEELTSGSAQDVGGSGLPNVVYAVAARARLLGSGSVAGAQALARARVQTPAGRWLVLHGSLLDDGRTAVIVEPARPPEMAPLITQAYGLSPRERDITQLIVQGLSTTEIARTLFLSPYTVQDHLKAIFDKVGVRSRRELVARIFFQHYAPRMRGGDNVGPDGWFTA
jgi:DNA-binding CsgD family transcriptional regulator